MAYVRRAPSPGGEEALLVRPGGLEPPTFWSVARRSIQLSYGRFSYLAEREGFEPSVQLPVQLLSRQLPSATRAPLLTSCGCQITQNGGGRGTRTPKGVSPAVFKTAALPIRTSPPTSPRQYNNAFTASQIESPSPLSRDTARPCRNGLTTSSSSSRSQSDPPADAPRSNARSLPPPIL